MARKAKSTKKKSSIFGTSWKDGSARKAIGGYIKKKVAKVKKSLKKSAKKALR